jgi:hypothetical protein
MFRDSRIDFNLPKFKIQAPTTTIKKPIRSQSKGPIVAKPKPKEVDLMDRELVRDRENTVVA